MRDCIRRKLHMDVDREGWDGGIQKCREKQYEDAPALTLPRYRKGGDKT